MGMLNSLGSPAKKAGAATSKAFRRLFGRALPTGPGTGPGIGTGTSTEPSTGSSAAREGTAGNTPAASSTRTYENNYDHNHNTNNHNNNDEQGNQTSTHKDKYNDLKNVATSEAISPPPSHPSTTSANGAEVHLNSTAHSKTINRDTMASLNQDDSDKENASPHVTSLTDTMDRLTIAMDEKLDLVESTEPHPPPPVFIDDDPVEAAERQIHMRFTEEALDMARLALRTNETPVGCVLVHDGKVIARGMNATNVTRNGTRHAEFMALCALFSRPAPTGPKMTCLKPKPGKSATTIESLEDGSMEARQPDEGNEDGGKGHLYPYGQKEHPEALVDPAIIRETTLYVTVEPCIMCASLLRQLGIKKVYFGAVNDKFGGTGGVFSVHANSLPISPDGQTASAHPTPRPKQLPDGNWTLGISYPPGGGDGGNIEPGYEIEGGWGRDDAVALLRRFYVQENGRAPIPRKKEGRAARLAAMMEDDGEMPPDGEGDETPSGNSRDQDDLERSRDSLKENMNPNDLLGNSETEFGRASTNSEDLLGSQDDFKGFKGCIR